MPGLARAFPAEFAAWPTPMDLELGTAQFEEGRTPVIQAQDLTEANITGNANSSGGCLGSHHREIQQLSRKPNKQLPSRRG